MNAMHRWKYAAILAVLALVGGPYASARSVEESMRGIPIAYSVDVVVVGGTTGAVCAAVEAAQQGGDVFLAAPMPYLGEDVCGTYRLWLEPGEVPETPLAEALFAEPPRALGIGQGLPFTYETDVPSGGIHPDKTPPSTLSDGQWANASTQSVEYGENVTITLDLGFPVDLGAVHVLAFQRPNDFEVERATIFASTDKEQWTLAGVVTNASPGAGDYTDRAFVLSAPVTETARYVRVAVEKTARVKRILLGEIVVEPATETAARRDASQASLEGYRIPPRPLQIKRALDQALIDAGVQFLYGSMVTDVLRDADGRLAGIVMANRSGRQAVVAKTIIDATPRASVARLAGASFAPYEGGPHTFTRVVVDGEAHEGDGIVVRERPTPVQIDSGAPTGDALRPAFEYTLTINMADDSPAAFAEAEQIARDHTWDPAQVAASDMLFELPPDAMVGERRLSGAWPGVEQADLDLFRPAGVSGLYVLGGCAAVSRQAAAAMLRPLAFMDLGARIGGAAAAEAGVSKKACVVCFGDSITASAYPAKLGRLLPTCRVANAGVGGNTSTQGLARFDSDVVAVAPAAVAILFGANDCVLAGPRQYQTSVDTYEANLRAMVAECRKHGIRALLCTPTPMVAEAYFTRHPKALYDDEGGLDAILARYREAVRRVGQDTETPVVDLYAALVDDASWLFPDGVHPSPKAERLIAERVAEALAPRLGVEARVRAVPAGLHVAAGADAVTDAGEVREFLNGIRPIQSGLPTVASDTRALPVLGEYDVVVVGGGTGGAPAGIGAAQHGAKTLVVEYLSGLGGVGTLGLIGSYYYGNRIGFTAKVDRGLADMEGPEAKVSSSWNVEWKMEWYRNELRGAHADIWFHTLGCGALVEDGRVVGVIVATLAGRGVVLAKAVIDSTGNSDIAAAAGAQTTFTDATHVAVQGTGMPPRQPGASYTNTDYTITDDGDMLDMWRTYVAGRTKYESAYDLGQIIDTRERRRIVGDFTISPLDIFNGRTFPDTVVYSCSNFDTHGYTVDPFFMIKAPDKEQVFAYTPYRCHLPKGLDGILVTGLGISAHRDAMPILRMQPDIQNQGYAMGVAAAMAVDADTVPRHIDVKALQRHLVEIGNIPEHCLTDTDSYPLSLEAIREGVTSLAADYAGLGVILTQPDTALPLLRAAYTGADADAAKLVYAHVLGMLGDAAGVETLLDVVTTMAWDAGWSFTGGGQFGASVSPLDSYIIALGRTGDARAVEPILAKVTGLDSDSSFSHHRAVAVALETLRDHRAAEPLAALLRKPGMMGHAYWSIEDAQRGAQSPNPNSERDRSLRELILARALYRCGDCGGLGETILREYEQDLRGHHARHAHAVLAE